MTDEIAVTDGGITIQDKDRRFLRVSTPPGFTDLAFRNAVTAFDNAYRMQGSFPTVDDVHRFFPRITKAAYSRLFLTDEFKQAISYRGYDWDVDNGLSIEQSMALMKITDWTDRRSIKVKLSEMGIPFARWQAWNKNPLFKEMYRRQSENNLDEAIPVATNALISKAESEDIQAIKFIFEVTGRYNPAAQAVEDARTVVMAVLEAVIKHTDPKTREAILSEVRSTTATISLVPQSSEVES